MLGFFTGLLKNFFFIGYSIVEAIVFLIAFNVLAPYVNDNLLVLPVTSIDYWTSLCLFIMIHFVGQFIGKLTPKFVNVSNDSKSE